MVARTLLTRGRKWTTRFGRKRRSSAPPPASRRRRGVFTFTHNLAPGAARAQLEAGSGQQRPRGKGRHTISIYALRVCFLFAKPSFPAVSPATSGISAKIRGRSFFSFGAGTCSCALRSRAHHLPFHAVLRASIWEQSLSNADGRWKTPVPSSAPRKRGATVFWDLPLPPVISVRLMRWRLGERRTCASLRTDPGRRSSVTTGVAARNAARLH